MQERHSPEYNVFTGTPTLEQLNEWHKKSIEVKFILKPSPTLFYLEDTLQGIIREIDERAGGGTRITLTLKHIINFEIHTQEYLLELNNIHSFSITESIYMLESSDPEDSIYLGVNEENYLEVNKKVLAERLNYFCDQKFTTGQKIILNFLTEDELKILIKAIEYKNIDHLNFSEAMSLLVIADKLADIKLTKDAKNLIFNSQGNLLPYKNNKDNPIVIQKFINNLKNEMLIWATENSSPMAACITCFNFDELEKSNHLHLDFKLFKKACSDYTKKYGNTLIFDINILINVLKLLYCCEYNIEKLSIQNAHSNDVDKVCKSLDMKTINIKSIEITLNDLHKTNSESRYTNISFKEEFGFLSLLKNKKSVTNITISPKLNEKTSEKIEKYLMVNKFYRNANLLFCASKFDQQSIPHMSGFADCLKHITKSGMKDNTIELVPCENINLSTSFQK